MINKKQINIFEDWKIVGVNTLVGYNLQTRTSILFYIYPWYTVKLNITF